MQRFTRTVLLSGGFTLCLQPDTNKLSADALIAYRIAKNQNFVGDACRSQLV